MIRVDPKFEGRTECLVAAARSTSFIAVKRHQKPDVAPEPYQSGTAFFISPTILLTAGHIVHDHKDTIIIEMPGNLEAEYFPERLFQTSAGTSHGTVMCKLLETGYPDADVSVLEVVGSFKSANYLSIEQHKFVAGPDAVDVIGYPGLYTEKQVLHMHPSEHLVDRHMVHDVETLF